MESDVALAKQTAPEVIQKVVIKHEKERLQVMGQLSNADTTMSVTLLKVTKPNVSLIAGSGLVQDS